jgi:hypothetical protein
LTLILYAASVGTNRAYHSGRDFSDSRPPVININPEDSGGAPSITCPPLCPGDFAIQPLQTQDRGPALCSQSGMDENLEEQRVFFRGKLLRGKVLFLL